MSIYQYLDSFSEKDILSAVVERLFELRVRKDSVHRAISDLLLYSDDVVEDAEYYMNLFISLNDKSVRVKTDRIKDKDLEKAIESFCARYSEILKYEYSDNNFIVVDYGRDVIKHIIYKPAVKGDNKSIEEVVFAVPVSYNVNYNVFTDKEEHIIKWRSAMRPKPFEFVNASFKQMSDKLKNMNFVINPRYYMTALACVQRIMYENGLLDLTRDIRTPGFYIHPETGGFVEVDCNIREVDLDTSLKCLEELIEALSVREAKAMTVLKWYMMAPFGFIKKQKGYGYYKWLYLWGSSKVGKSSLCFMFARMWNTYSGEYDSGGSHANTEHRISMQLAKSTFPIILNETRLIFQTVDMQDLVKTASESVTSRSKDDHGEFITLPAFNTPVLTSNDNLPAAEGLGTRFINIEFHRDEVQEMGERVAFDDKFRIKEEDSPLNDLQGIGYFVKEYVKKNLDILELDFASAAELLIEKMYEKVDRECPEVFRLNYSVDEDRVDKDKVEIFRHFFIKTVNNEARNFRSARGDTTFQQRFNVVLENECLSYLYRNNKNDVLFSTGVLHELNRYDIVETSLKSLAILLGFKYEKSKHFQKTNKTCMYCNEEVLFDILGVDYDGDFDFGEWYDEEE